MPTYSYKCTECGAAFDIHQEFSDASLTECPTCGGRLRKVFSSIGVTFNGPGFYSTDSRSGTHAHDDAHPSAEKSSKEAPSGTAPKTPAGTGEKKAPGTAKAKPASPAPVS